MAEVQQQITKDTPRETDKELTAKAILSLKTKFSKQYGWSSFLEVSLRKRQADFMAFNIFPSRDFAIVGCEIKASRSDWTHELEHPEKADPLVAQCDEWYIVEARQGIVKKDELPKGWGLMSMRGTRLYTTVRSAKPKCEISREFIARVIERAYRTPGGNHPDYLLMQAEQRGYTRGRQEGQDEWEVKRLRERAKLLDDLEAADIKLREYDLKDIKRLRLALDFIDKLGGYPGIEDKLGRVLGACDSAAETTKEAQKLLQDLRSEVRATK